MVNKHGPFNDVVELGSLDINGGVRHLFAGAAYVGVDLVAGPGVDFVGDAALYRTAVPHDCVVCCEVLEHTPDAPRIIAAAAEALAPGGVLILTTACAPRMPHSAVDGGSIHPGEWYANIDPVGLTGWMQKAGLHIETLEVHDVRGDLYSLARKP